MYDEHLFYELQEKVYAAMDPTRVPEDEVLFEVMDRLLLEDVAFRGLCVQDKIDLRRKIHASVKGLDLLTELLEDERITEIMVNGHDKIFVEKNGRPYRLEARFESEERLFQVIQRILASGNRVVNESSPIVDTRLPDGSRVNVVLHPISLDGSALTIRKFPNEVMTMERLISYGSISEEVAGFLKRLVKARYNIFISGGTSSGKTSMLNALSGWIPKHERILTIEDSAEIRIEGIENLIRLEVRNANVEGRNEVTMRQLIRSALRMRPDRILVGEVRGEETVEMLQAMNTGHSGSISTGHANSAADMLARLETMVIMAIDIPLAAVRSQIASALEIIIHLGRMRDGKRRLLEIQEVLGVENGEIVLSPLYRFEEEGTDRRGEVIGSFRRVNELQQTEKMRTEDV